MVESEQRPAAHILIVDDYADSREMYAEMLSFAGYLVVTAKDGEEALERAEKEHLLPLRKNSWLQFSCHVIRERRRAGPRQVIVVQVPWWVHSEPCFPNSNMRNRASFALWRHYRTPTPI